MITQKLEKYVKKLFLTSGYNIDKVTVNVSNRLDLCDYQCNDIFKLSKIYHQAPQVIGNNLLSNVDEELKKVFSKIEFVLPGFINLTLSDEFINENLEVINNENLGLKKEIKEKFIIDYGGPNVAKPLHVGHMRTAIVGESIKRIIKFMGHEVIADIHLGDYGLQIGQVIYGLEEENISINDINIDTLNRIYPKISNLCKEDEKLKTCCALITKKLQDNDSKYQKYWKKILEVSVSDMKKLYDYLDVHFDLWNGESDAYPYLKQVEEILQKKSLCQESQGALIVDVKKDTDTKEIPPLLYKKSNGAYLYASTDLATIFDRVNKYHPDHILYVVDNRQELHFEQVFRAADLADIYPYNNLEFLGYGTVNGTDNKPYKTRDGNAPSLQELFEETKKIFISKKTSNEHMAQEDIDKIVNAILKFADLQNSREKDYVFDLNKFSDVIGKTGPYILYTYVRINKILKNLNIDVIKSSNKIYNDIDRKLRLKILEVPEVINNAYKARKPVFIADYIYNLCVLANSFYQTNHVSTASIDKQQNWGYVLQLLNRVIKQLLNLLVIDIPSKM